MLEGLNGSEDCKYEQKRAMGHQSIQRKLLRRKRKKWGGGGDTNYKNKN